MGHQCDGTTSPVSYCHSLRYAEHNRWTQKEDSETRFAKDGVSYSAKYSFDLLILASRYYFSGKPKGTYVATGLSTYIVASTIGTKGQSEEKDLSTSARGFAFGAGFSFLEHSKFDLTVGARIILSAFNGTKSGDWPEFEDQPDSHLINDVIENPVVKGDITIGYRL